MLLTICDSLKDISYGSNSKEKFGEEHPFVFLFQNSSCKGRIFNKTMPQGSPLRTSGQSLFTGQEMLLPPGCDSVRSLPRSFRRPAQEPHQAQAALGQCTVVFLLLIAPCKSSEGTSMATEASQNSSHTLCDTGFKHNITQFAIFCGGGGLFIYTCFKILINPGIVP